MVGQPRTVHEEFSESTTEEMCAVAFSRGSRQLPYSVPYDAGATRSKSADIGGFDKNTSECPHRQVVLAPLTSANCLTLLFFEECWEMCSPTHFECFV